MEVIGRRNRKSIDVLGHGSGVHMPLDLGTNLFSFDDWIH
jgi:hypothetical protein